jgi:TM2 domain-containing membrane protein YozV
VLVRVLGGVRRVAKWVAVLVSAALGSALLCPAAATATTAHVLAAPITSNFWLATPTGSMLSFGVPSYGSAPGPLNQPIVNTATTADRHGYWMVASDGGVFSFGDARFYGSTGSLVLNKPIVGMAPTPDQRGYWLVASDGGVFSFGDARFYGSTGSLVLDQPVVSMTATPDAAGYWLVAADGGVFSFGDARFFGSAAGSTGEPVERLVRTGSGRGYWIVEQNGTELPYGDATGASPPDLALFLEPITPGDRAVLFAFEQLGKPYIWGGNGPVGYDCSGLALASWSHGAGVSFARVADDQYHTAGVPVAMNDLQTGDLVFWGTDLSDWTSVYHTALYVGGNRIVEATGDQVQLNLLGQWGTGNLMPNGRRP